MLYAQFYQMSTGYIPGTIPPQFGEPLLIEASGDRSVIVLDGRILESFNLNIARQECDIEEITADRFSIIDSIIDSEREN